MQRLVVDYIQNHPDDWRDSLRLMKVRVNESHPKLMLLTYGPDADFTNPIVCECRGMILEKETLKVVSIAFDKFFNFGEPNCDDIDWASARVTQKMDGSLVTLYWYDGQWHVKSNGTIDASTVATQSNPNKNFTELFYEAEKFTPIAWDKLDHDVCYSFELMAPENRVIIEYDHPMIRFLLARNRNTGDEIDYTDETNPTGVPMPTYYPCRTIEECRTALKKFDDDGRKDVEGFVVCDKYHRRVKIKTQFYVDAHHLRGELTMTVKNAIHIIRGGDMDEFVSYSPWRKQYMEDVRAKYVFLRSTIATIAQWVKNFKFEHEQQNGMEPSELRKLFVQYVSKRPRCLSGFFFNAFDGKITTADDYLATMTDSKIESVITNKEFLEWTSKFDSPNS